VKEDMRAMCVGTGEVLRDDRSTGNKGREGTNYKCVGDAGVMATLCKDGGRQTGRGKTRSLTLHASQGFGCGMGGGRRVAGRNLQPFLRWRMSQSLGIDEPAGRILNAGRITNAMPQCGSYAF